MVIDLEGLTDGHRTDQEGIERFGPTPAGEMVTIHAGGEETGGQFDFMVTTVEPGPGVVPLHIHHENDETFYVLDGTLEARVGDETMRLEAGAFVMMPRGVPHTWRNASDEPSQFVCMYTPGNHFGVLQELAQLDVDEDDPDPDKFAPILDAYDIEMVGPPMGQA